MDTKLQKIFDKMTENFGKSLNNNVRIRYLENAQEALEVGPTGMAKLLCTSLNTYKAWLYGQNPVPSIAIVAVEGIMFEKFGHKHPWVVITKRLTD